MKLVVAVVQAEDAGGLLTQLANRGFRATRIKTAGGFLRETNATVFVGVEDEEVEMVMHTIRENCTTRQQQITAIPAVMEPGEFFLPYPVEVEVGGATIFVLDVARFERV
ncbi:MAG: cyclic-di-AMP receptor [Chloroflexota bacterium]|nr:cyclic-di-AMP receptor [Chloroflexota bacterium]